MADFISEVAINGETRAMRDTRIGTGDTVQFGMRRRQWWVPGTYTWTVPLSLPIVEVVGGIGYTEIFITGCGGGGGADCVIGQRFLIEPGITLNIIVGAGGLSTIGQDFAGEASVISGLVTLLGGRPGGRGSGNRTGGNPGGAGGGSFGDGTNASNLTGDNAAGFAGSNGILGKGGSAVGRRGGIGSLNLFFHSSQGIAGSGGAGGNDARNANTALSLGGRGGNGFIRIDH